MSEGEAASIAAEGLLPIDRQRRILEILRHRGSVRSHAIARELGVTPATLRRDLQVLSNHYGVNIVHGGASYTGAAPAGLLPETDLRTKQVTKLPSKQLIAHKAADLIEDGDTIALNAGSTVEMILEQPRIAEMKDLTVVTLSLNVAARAASIPGVRLFLAGGYYRPSSQAFVGDSAELLLNNLRVDKALLGASAVDLTAGWTHPAMAEVATNRLMLACAQKRYLVCDSSKFDQISFAKICDLPQFDGIVSDSEIPGAYRAWAAETGVEIV